MSGNPWGLMPKRCFAFQFGTRLFLVFMTAASTGGGLVSAADQGPVPSTVFPERDELRRARALFEKARSKMSQAGVGIGEGEDPRCFLSRFKSSAWGRIVGDLKAAEKTFEKRLGPHHNLTIEISSFLSNIYERAGRPTESDAWLERLLRPFFWTSNINLLGEGPLDVVDSSRLLLHGMDPELMAHPLSGVQQGGIEDSTTGWHLDLLHSGLRVSVEIAKMDPLVLGFDGMEPFDLVLASLRSPDPMHKRMGLELMEALIKQALVGDSFQLPPRAIDEHFGWENWYPCKSAEWRNEQLAAFSNILSQAPFRAAWPRNAAKFGSPRLRWLLQELGKQSGIYRQGPQVDSVLARCLFEAGVPTADRAEPSSFDSNRSTPPGIYRWPYRRFPTSQSIPKATAFERIGADPREWDEVWEEELDSGERRRVLGEMKKRAHALPENVEWWLQVLELLAAHRDLEETQEDPVACLERAFNVCVENAEKAPVCVQGMDNTIERREWGCLGRAAGIFLLLRHQRWGAYTKAAHLVERVRSLVVTTGCANERLEQCLGFTALSKSVRPHEEWWKTEEMTRELRRSYFRLARAQRVFAQFPRLIPKYRQPIGRDCQPPNFVISD